MQLLEKAVDHGVAYVPGGAFGTARDHAGAARLCFATYDGSVLAEGVERLRVAHEKLSRPSTPRPN